MRARCPTIRPAPRVGLHASSTGDRSRHPGHFTGKERHRMQVLVTGHRGYIGTVMMPMLLKAGHDVVGCDTDLYGAARTRQGGRSAAVRTLLEDVRDLKSGSRGLRCGDSSGRALQRSPGDSIVNVTYDINHRASVRWPAWPGAGVERFLSHLRAATTGGRRDLINENFALNPVTAYGVEGGRSSDIARTGERLLPDLLRPATAYGASPRLRFDIVLNNLVASAVTTGRDLPESATARLGGRSFTSRTYDGRSSPRSKRRGRSGSTKPSTSETPGRTFACASWRRSLLRSCPTADWRLRLTPVPTSGAIA